MPPDPPPPPPPREVPGDPPAPLALAALPAPPEPPAASPTPVAPAKTVAQAIAMAKKGQRGPAIEGLRLLWRKHPKVARYPYTLGNLYFDQKWWTVAMEHYTAAIKLSPGYRGNAVMIHNAIQALGNGKTRGKAWWFLKRVVGAKARPYLRTAAKKHAKPAVRSPCWCSCKARSPC